MYFIKVKFEQIFNQADNPVERMSLEQKII